MSEERTGNATVGGNPITLIGPELKVGDKAPEFTVNKDLMEEKSLSDYAGKIKLISVVPSLDTKVCEAQTRRFNEEATKFGDQVAVLTISVDLPFAQDRFCSVAGIDHLDTLSDYRTRTFGKNYGVLIKELQLDMRSIFIIDQENTIRYVQYVKEMTNHPDYEAALHALRSLI
ncbi:thiol peroxidase [Sporolactobacillus shoreicorticis]|uniref:Thiol peroxidase n=1 Tax=Sporolactobacillus shoreicorticis TaxID=1923877 RepID=A0ABW5S788_9BACL|nr:thiol peroxidase [Sporolactobacillus shoreicorticis]MCO7126864.1 thiol peroxidase [Sporolactobacillus shoreicorticis]